jgi:hypothetical protein
MKNMTQIVVWNGFHFWFMKIFFDDTLWCNIAYHLDNNVFVYTNIR